jgi:nucleotide-binding universal stress UspA family protein
MSKKFMVALDGSDHGWKALELAGDLARAADAALLVVHVVPYEPVSEGLLAYAKAEGISPEDMTARYHYSRGIGDRITAEAEARARERGLTQVSTIVAEGNPADEIVSLAKSEDVDMLFLGSRGLGDARGLLFGSTSHKVMHLAPCTCVAVK